MAHRGTVTRALLRIARDGRRPDALARLRGYAFARRRLLLDVARDVVERRLAFIEEMT